MLILNGVKRSVGEYLLNPTIVGGTITGAALYGGDGDEGDGGRVGVYSLQVRCADGRDLEQEIAGSACAQMNGQRTRRVALPGVEQQRIPPVSDLGGSVCR